MTKLRGDGMFERKAFYSPQEVAEIAGLSTSTVLNYVHSGRLYAVKLSERTYRIPLASLIATFYPELKRPPKIVTRRGNADAEWQRELDESHAAFDRAVAAVRRARPPERGRRRRTAARA